MLLTAVVSMTAYNAQASDDPAAAPQEGKTVIVYFSKTVPEGVDATTGATPTATYKGRTLGATQYIATLVQEQTGADVQRITVADDHYPVEYNALADFAKDERDKDIHPTLTSTHNLSQYQNVIIGMPVWWYTMPMPMYSFFNNVDLSGKNVYIFTTHAGSGLNNNPKRVKDVEPNANVSTDGLAVSGERVAQNAPSITTWLQRIGLYKDQSNAVNKVKMNGSKQSPAYNLQGQRVVQGRKGIVIKNGKKQNIK